MNKVILIGNISSDIEKNTTASGLSVCKFSLAVGRRFSKDETDFFNITCWRTLADNCAKNLAKGRKICVTGSIQMRKYQAQDGSNRTAVDIIADDVEYLSPRTQDQGTSQEGSRQAPVAGLQEEPAVSDGDLPF